MKVSVIAACLALIAVFFFEGCSSGIQPDPSSTSNAAAVPGEKAGSGPDVAPSGMSGARVGW